MLFLLGSFLSFLVRSFLERLGFFFCFDFLSFLSFSFPLFFFLLLPFESESDEEDDDDNSDDEGRSAAVVTAGTSSAGFWRKRMPP